MNRVLKKIRLTVIEVLIILLAQGETMIFAQSFPSMPLRLNSFGSLDTEAPLTGGHGQCEPNGDHPDTPVLHAYAAFSHVYPLNLLLTSVAAS